VDLKQLRALVTVAECGSVTRAADLLQLVQPAVSRQISSLEHELGVVLFERSRQGMRPTREGSTLVTRAQRVLAELERARAELEPPGEVTGIVTVGILGSLVELLAEPLLSNVSERLPGVELRLATAYSGHLHQWLDSGDLDLSLLYDLRGSQMVRVQPLVSDELWAVAPASAGLRADRPVRLATVFTQPFIMPMAGRHGLRILIDQARVSCAAEPRVVAQADSMSLQTLLVEGGHGWTILPASGAASGVAGGRLSAAPITDPEIRRTIGLGLPRAGIVSPAAEMVGAELTRLARASVLSGAWAAARLTDEVASSTASP
jgi:DNA-binding transcriptional LysR family regulator